MKGMVPADVRGALRKAYGRDPQIVASAPGRVNLIGEHTDYNGGQVLPIGIDRRTWIALGRTQGVASRAVSATEAEAGAFDITRPARTGKWWDYLLGVAAELKRPLPQLDIAVTSDVPTGAGLSSSAALEVAFALALTKLVDEDGPAAEIALTAWRAETTFVGVQCGIMDQFASALAVEYCALHLWCDTQRTEQVPFDEFVLIFDTGVTRALRESEFNARQDECREALQLLQRRNPALRTLSGATRDEVLSAHLPLPLDRRALHVVEENLRVSEAAEHLARDRILPAHLLYESHSSLRDLYECSSPELDWFVERAMREPGVNGARLTGAGWGGCAIAVGAEGALKTMAARASAEYRTAFGKTARTWISRASAGASLATPAELESST